MKIVETDGYKEFKSALVKLQMGFIGMFEHNTINMDIKIILDDIEEKLKEFGNIEIEEVC